ncbi:MAG: toll/interleukin-1 receptor domain-containing protein [Bacteroidales bacterium]|nr:toll/interleukin-1 receptor domain-containing protein [Bacteroidales bacterium]
MSQLNKTNSWIFISHSHRDMEKVRQIRNYLEKHGANPLLFFLKCLNDDDARLPELISDEILARNFFILCDSENARNSSWVQKEQAIVMNMGNIVKETIDLGQDIKSQYYKLDRICKKATIFISYAHQDRNIAEQIIQKLIQNDYSVWIDNEIEAGCNWSDEIHGAIDDAVERGFVMVLLSPASLTSQCLKSETEYALELASKSGKSNIIPVVISPFDPGMMPPQLTNIKWFDLTIETFDQRVEELLSFLNKQEIY